MGWSKVLLPLAGSIAVYTLYSDVHAYLLCSNPFSLLLPFKLLLGTTLPESPGGKGGRKSQPGRPVFAQKYFCANCCTAFVPASLLKTSLS